MQPKKKKLKFLEQPILVLEENKGEYLYKPYEMTHKIQNP